MNKYTVIQLLDIIGKIVGYDDLHFYKKKKKERKEDIIKKLEQLLIDKNIMNDELKNIAFNIVNERNDIITKIKRKDRNIKNKTFYNMTLNDLILFYNDQNPSENQEIESNNTLSTLTPINNKTIIKNILKVNHLFEHNISIFLDIPSLLQLRLTNKFFKQIIFNSKISKIFVPKKNECVKNIVLKIFRFADKLELKWGITDIYASNIITGNMLGSLDILILSSVFNEKIIIDQLTNRHTSYKLREL